MSWSKSAGANTGYANFRSYLDVVFTYAGTASISKELKKVGDPRDVRIGDVFIQGGFPGHAVLVVDVAQNRRSERIFLLAQSFMPAQEIHVLRNPSSSARLGPWYKARAQGDLPTPEWRFQYTDLKRFATTACENGR